MSRVMLSIARSQCTRFVANYEFVSHGKVICTDQNWIKLTDGFLHTVHGMFLRAIRRSGRWSFTVTLRTNPSFGLLGCFSVMMPDASHVYALYVYLIEHNVRLQNIHATQRLLHTRNIGCLLNFKNGGARRSYLDLSSTTILNLPSRSFSFCCFTSLLDVSYDWKDILFVRQSPA
jgi:hypothetical protein